LLEEPDHEIDALAEGGVGLVLFCVSVCVSLASVITTRIIRPGYPGIAGPGDFVVGEDEVAIVEAQVRIGAAAGVRGEHRLTVAVVNDELAGVGQHAGRARTDGAAVQLTARRRSA